MTANQDHPENQGEGKPNLETLRTWLEMWQGPHWADASGETVPLSKVTLGQLIDWIEDLLRDHHYHEARELQLLDLLYKHNIPGPAFDPKWLEAT